MDGLHSQTVCFTNLTKSGSRRISQKQIRYSHNKINQLISSAASVLKGIKLLVCDICNVCAVTMFCCGNTSRRRISYVRRVSVVTQSSPTCFVPTSITEHTGLRNTAPVLADSRHDRCDRLTLVLILATVQATVVEAGDTIREVCLHRSCTHLAFV